METILYTPVPADVFGNGSRSGTQTGQIVSVILRCLPILGGNGVDLDSTVETGPPVAGFELADVSGQMVRPRGFSTVLVLRSLIRLNLHIIIG